MHKKTQRANYALASSSISDIPLSIDKRENHSFNKMEGADSKQNSSVYQAFNQSRSRVDEGSSLHYSTARPFYEDAVEDYYERRQMGEKLSYNIQQKNHYNLQKFKSRKSPNKKIMIYSYSNITLFAKKIDKAVTKTKKRIFQIIRKIRKEEKHLLGHYNKNNSFYSGETNNTSHDDAFFRVNFGLKRQEKYQSRHQMIQGFNLMQTWFDYKILFEKRKAFYNIIQYGNGRKRFSLQLSQSLKIDNSPNQNYYFTESPYSNQISLTQGLPQQIQQSLVYTLENNNQSTRKQFTQSTLQKIQTAKQCPSTMQIQEKQWELSSESQTNKKSQISKLKPFKNSRFATQIQVNIGKIIKIEDNIFNKPSLNIDSYLQNPIQLNHQIDPKDVIKVQKEIQNDTIQVDIIDQDKQGQQAITFPFNEDKINQNSARFSDVSSYKADATVHSQEQAYKLKVNYVNNNQPIVQDQTVLRKFGGTFQDNLKTSAKIQKLFLDPKQPIQSMHQLSNYQNDIPHTEQKIMVNYRPNIEQEKIISQLQNDRIRIYNKIRLPQQQISPRQNAIRQPNDINRQRPNLVYSPKVQQINPHMISSDKRILSPPSFIQANKGPINNLKEVNYHPHKLNQQVTNQRIEPSLNHISNKMREFPIVNQRIIPQPLYYEQIQRETSPKIIKTAKTITIPPSQLKLVPKKLSPQPIIISKNQINSPQKSIKIMNNIKRIQAIQTQDYGLTQNIPLQREHFGQKKNYFLLQKNFKYGDNQYQLPPIQTRFPSPNIQRIQQFNLNQQIVEPYQRNLLQKTQRPQSSVSSPKLTFNYKAIGSHIQQQIAINSNLTKNSSSISRPKSMNSKLHVTLRKEL